jgi:carbon monoxide dehydrogenase subunit G
MSVSKYVSDVKIVNNNQEIIYNFLSNFENLSKYINDGLLEKLSEQVPQIKISDFESDADSCRFQIAGMGQAEIRIEEREPHKTVKIISTGSMPIGVKFWVQLLPVSAYETKLRLTLEAEMSMMIKMLVGRKLEDGINKMADVLAALPYR